MSSLELYPADEKLPRSERIVFDLYIITAVVLFVLMMLLGLSMRLTQATWAGVGPKLFYEILTMHGAGMVGTTALATVAVMWFFLRKYVKLHLWAFLTNYMLFLLGALAIIIAIFVGGYAGMWTFLYPLPVHSEGIWSNNAAALFFIGYLLIGVGFLLFYLDASAGIIRKFGNFGRAMGLQWLFGGTIDQSHPKTVVASTMVIIANSIGILAGAVVLVMCLINAYFPTVVLNALVVKELIYWFGHMFINATIYMGVIAVYELLPRYTGRPYTINRVFLWAWAVSCVFVIVVFPHHLLMDFAQPRWLAIIGQVVSWGAGFPVFLVTAYGVLTNIYRSNIRWKMPSRLMVLSVFGWAAGIVPAMLDGTIVVNKLMHNTQWVPGHFHFYIILGVLPMALATMYHVIGSRAQSPDDVGGDKLSIPLFLVGGLTFVLAFLYAGDHSVPRRYAVHLPQWLPYDKAGSIGAMLIILGMLLFAVRIIAGLLKVPADVGSAHPGG
ncbi:MAG TPA: cbb3-type cytochrome c oxidase subunit I [Gammaproteobacteria bacterium]|nr:cbb3-type cytochrome c oxidase subunit I [Gammaproteobacteria bacterium]